MLTDWVSFTVSEERRVTVFKEISAGSTPAPRFYLMVVVSNLIAVLGLISNSPPVVIGAMLVAPLMTPIFGIALALIRGTPRLLARALRAEIQGVGLCILLGFLFGLIPLAMSPTPEMQARFQPNLLDLFIAVLAGVAGSYAMVDERISPSLPGVAIATAIVPPLANAGYSLALGEIAGGLSSFVLFLANFLSILIASSVVFAATGMGAHTKELSKQDLARRFGLAALLLAIISILFTFSLVGLVQKRHLRNTIKYELAQGLAEVPGTHLREFMWDETGDHLDILATVRTPGLLNPVQVERIQDRITTSVKRDTRLVLRNNLVKDIAAVGSTVQLGVIEEEEMGEFLADHRSPTEKKVSLAEQVLWERFSKWPGFRVQSVQYRTSNDVNIILVTVQSPFPFTKEELVSLEGEIRRRVNDPNVFVGLTRSRPTVMNARGLVVPGWTFIEKRSQNRRKRLATIETAVREEMAEMTDVFFEQCHFRVIEGQWSILVETAGLRPLTPEELQQIKANVSQKVGKPFELYAWFQPEVIVTPDGYTSYHGFMQEPIAFSKEQWETDEVSPDSQPSQEVKEQ